MSTLLRQRLETLAPQWQQQLHTLLSQHGNTPIADIRIEQVIGGMRGVPALLCETSLVIPTEGLRIRNIPITEIADRTPEAIFWLLCTGELPTAEEHDSLRQALAERATVPEYVWNVLHALPRDAHPMAMLSLGLLAMEQESAFRRAFEEGASRGELWKALLEDCLTLLGRITTLAAGIYRIRFSNADPILPDLGLDWASNFARMLGLPDPTGQFRDLVRLYLVLHSDHEGGNVSALTGYTVASALSDPFYALSAGLNGLAGPLHGLANQECLRFLLQTLEALGPQPSDDVLEQYVWNWITSGHVIPGYGHAVLRVTDPRFTIFRQFAERYHLQHELIALVNQLFQIVPRVLQRHGKAKNPWPNVDAISGSLLYIYGMREFEFYTVMFGVSRALGICAQILVHRILGTPIMRPKSLTLQELEQMARSTVASHT
ncbi:MAG: citrate (Si)-synthase [Candidatus Kapabacteria bacterium]|nr:citrate (Si)-synthase [Candidatus Kapabacteria bacterium]